jgi:hypothetical protein
MMEHYRLADDGYTAIPVADVIEWAKWYSQAERRVAVDRVGTVTISTVFLALDHQFDEGKPVLWETMIFGGPLNDYQRRYSSRDEAIAGHAVALSLVTATEHEVSR